MKNIALDVTKATQFLAEGTVKAYEPKVKAAQEALENGTCPGNDFLGWLHLPSSITPDFLQEIQACADVLRENCEAVVVAGIGGSYLGARAVIEALGNSFAWLVNDKKSPTMRAPFTIVVQRDRTDVRATAQCPWHRSVQKAGESTDCYPKIHTSNPGYTQNALSTKAPPLGFR